ncbi:Vps52 [Trinorchestia longiramus]|nr:Vps52 [Trinorchestia longiramus]
MASELKPCSGCEFDYFLTIAQFHEDNCGSLDLLRTHGALPLSVTCPNCLHSCKFCTDQRTWCCTRSVTTGAPKCRKLCSYSVSDYSGTLLQNSDVDPWKLVLFLNHFLSKNWDFKTIHACLDWSYRTWNDWRSFCSTVARKWFENQDPIGGPGVKVEIDAIFFNKLECQESINSSKIWLFGGIERKARKKFIVPLFSKVYNTESIFPLIFKHIKPGSVIYSDSGCTYETLKNYGYEHYVTKQFVDRRNPEINTQIIHRLWRDVKESMKKCDMKPGHLEDHLFRYLFTSYPESGNILHRFLVEVARLHPHETNNNQSPLVLPCIKKEVSSESGEYRSGENFLFSCSVKQAIHLSRELTRMEAGDAMLGDAVIQDALTSNTDLRQYSHRLEDKLKELEQQSITDLIKKADHIASLHGHITTCDDILLEMQGALEGYLSHLSSISQELQSLQEQSTSLHQQLHNTTAAKQHVTAALDSLTLPSFVIHHIFNTPVTEPAFMEQLIILDEKSKFLKEQRFKDASSVADVDDLVSKLSVRAVSKIREYLLQKIYQFRKPLSNYHIPQNAMIKHKFFFEFLLQHARTIAGEVHDEYVDTMSKVYFSYFQAYTKQLYKFQYEEQVTREDLLAADDFRSGAAGGGAGATAAGFFGGRSAPRSRLNSVFALANRDVVLSPEGLTEDIIVPHVAEREGKKFGFEVLFRSQQFALLDNCCREYTFLSQFFLVTDADALKLFKAVLATAIQLVQKEVYSLVMGSFDSVGLCVCLHLCHQYKLLCHKRAVPALDAHWDALTGALYQRFEYVIRLNIQSVQDCDVTKFTNMDVRPHYMCRRISELCGAIASLERRFPIEGTEALVAALHRELESVLLRLSAYHFPRDRMQQLVFLINNYDMVLGVLTEKARSDCSEGERLREMLAACTAEYIHEILTPDFGALLNYAQQAQQLLDAGDSQGLKQTEGTALNVARAFSNNWRTAVEQLNNQASAPRDAVFQQLPHGHECVAARTGDTHYSPPLSEPGARASRSAAQQRPPAHRQ